MSFKWTRDVIESLIVIIQQHECIYNVRSKAFLNRTKKCEAFNAICTEMQVKTPEISVPEIKKKWSNIRIQYMAEKRRMLNSKKSGAGAGDDIKPRLWCFDQLDFLNFHTELRKSCSNIEGSLISESFSAESTDHFSRDESFEYAPRNKNKSQSSHAFAKDLADLKGLAEKRSKNVKKYAWLGALVTNQMENVSVDDQKAACWEVQCVMNKYVQESQQSELGTVSLPTNEGETDVTECIIKKYIQKSQQKNFVPILPPLSRTEEETDVTEFDNVAYGLVEDTCDMSVEFLFDEDD